MTNHPAAGTNLLTRFIDILILCVCNLQIGF